MAWLRRDALRRVLQSLLTAELGRNSRARLENFNGLSTDGAWPESLAIGDDGTSSLHCDSLERLWLAAAVNEMFCLYDAKVEDSLLGARTFGDWIDIVGAGWNNAGQRITFSTSGSSAVPKRCTHDMTHLQREVQFLTERFAGMRRVIAIALSHHIYGFLLTAMLPSLKDVPVVDASELAPGVLLREMRADDLVVSFPARWEWLARSIPEWPKGVNGITSTAPCPEALKRTLVENGLATFTEVYGSSETAGVGLRTFPETRYTIMPHWRWADGAIGGVEQAVILQGDSGRRFPLQDRLDIANDGSFVVRGRLDGAVQVGGVNVFPGRLEEQLRALPGVADAAVRLLSVGRGEGLKAFLVPNGSVAETELAQTLQAWSQTLPAPERVRAFTFGSELPRTPMGKLDDWNTDSTTVA